MSIFEIILRKASIAGRVTDSIMGIAIPHAMIKLTGKQQSSIIGQCETAEDGFYYLMDLPPGNYTITVSAPLLYTRYGSVTVEDIIVQSDPDGRPLFDTKANITLPPTRLKGYIKRNSDKQPLKDAIVQVCGSEIKTRSSIDGSYSIMGLQAGSPNVQACAEGYADMIKKATLIAGQELNLDFDLKNS